MVRILFICTGNVCRSPMAHYYAQKLANESSKPELYYIESAGINAYDGDRATDSAIKVMNKYNVDLSKHTATNIANSGIMESDYVITMTNLHKRILIEMFPEKKDKIYTLRELVYDNPEYLDIDDPWGYNLDIYEDISKQIIEAVDIFMKNLEAENE